MKRVSYRWSVSVGAAYPSGLAPLSLTGDALDELMGLLGKTLNEWEEALL